MKKNMFRLVALILILLIGFLIFRPNDFATHEVSYQELRQAFNVLNDSLLRPRHTFIDFIRTTESEPGTGRFEGVLVDGPFYHAANGIAVLARDDSATFEVVVDNDGLFELNLDYFFSHRVMTSATISLRINGDYQFSESATIDVPIFWHHEATEFDLNRFGDEMLPIQERIEEWKTLNIFNNTFGTAAPLVFELERGINLIEVTNLSSNELLLGNLIANQPTSFITYAEYRNQFPTVNTPSGQIVVNAIHYNQKNSSHIRMTSNNNPILYPFDPVYRLLNIIDGNSWQTSGQSITYYFEVETEGWYELTFHYMNEKNDFSVFRSISINDEIPFVELKSYAFEPTRPGIWAMETLNHDGVPFQFFFPAGIHSITLRAEVAPVSEEIRNLQLINDHINQFALDIIRIAGTDVDLNRTWRLTNFLPQTETYLEAYRTILKSVIQNAATYAPNGQRSAALSFLNRAIVMVDEMLENPDELPLHLEQLFTGTGSVAQMIGDTIDNLSTQPLSLSAIYISNDYEIPDANASFGSSAFNNVVSFISTFTTDRFDISDVEETINIWVNRPLTHVDTLQQLVDRSFTPQTGINVRISAMPDVNQLILANAAGNTPDIALGLSSFMPFDLAIRGALLDLTTFDDFWYVVADMPPGALIPFILNDGIYSIPETMAFQTLIYRTDVFEMLGITAPDTWDELIDILPVLQRYGMNFFHPTAGGGALKWFFQTSPLILQHGGLLYNEDGLSTAIDSPEAVRGMSQLVDLFRTHAIPAQVASFYNSFRHSTLPIGIAGFGEFMQIKNAAPELVGRWNLALYPGTVQDDGSIDRWFISNGVSGVIFEDTQMPNESWEFLRWWMSEETQTTYAYLLQSTFGPEFVWLSANLRAVENAPIDDVFRDVIIESAAWMRDIPRTPGQYMLERGLSDIWNRAVFDGVSTRVSIDSQVIRINREIERKMIEFGFIDSDGNILREYRIRDVDWVIEQLNYHTGGR